MTITLDDLRRFAVSHSLFPPTTLKRALHRMGFVQADPIRVPARAPDLTLRHRVQDYRGRRPRCDDRVAHGAVRDVRYRPVEKSGHELLVERLEGVGL